MLVGLIKSEQVVNLHRETGSALSLDDFIGEQVSRARVPIGRMVEAGEFADIACFLASDAASYLTGTAINVECGMAPVV